MTSVQYSYGSKKKKSTQTLEINYTADWRDYSIDSPTVAGNISWHQQVEHAPRKTIYMAINTSCKNSKTVK